MATTPKKTSLTGSTDFVLADNGMAIATLSFVDAAGVDTDPPVGATTVWSASSSAVTVSAGADGLSAIVAPSVPPQIVQGITISAVTTLADGTTVITSAPSDPIDVVAGGPAGSKIALTKK